MNRKKKSHILTMIYQIMVINSILNASHFSKIPYFSVFTKLMLLTLVFAGIVVWFGNKRTINKRLVPIVIILVTISLIVMKESDTLIAIVMVLYLMIFYQDVDPRRFCKKYVEAAVTAMLFVFVLCIIGVFPNEYTYRIARSGATHYRYTLGFNYPTVSSNFAFHISLAYLFYKQEKFKFRDAVILLIPNTILYFLTDTRAAYFEVLFAILFFGVLKACKRDWLKNAIGLISIWAMPLFAGTELYIAKNYSATNPIYATIDAALTYRLSWVARAIRTYPIGLFGNNIMWETGTLSDTSQLVDMFYLRCAIQYGLVFLFVIIIGFMGISAYLKSRGNYYGCIIILTLAIHSITDPQLIEYSCVPLLIMLLTGYKYILQCFRLKKSRVRLSYYHPKKVFDFHE